ncbi:hypothetical protein HLB44_10045 [Aquincola sp. S2]|uniref:YMGG-like Gly-zipper domain-containing protein n=1 Tax=Pseudaquabacterium terrae TaxID=2732868 RepID=A0ABX2EFC0_9BURK|nr:hypothetical protein [Aquabacterium terrae]NRF67325.1 hypothetical protein [Aquabacterium terrae]
MKHPTLLLVALCLACAVAQAQTGSRGPTGQLVYPAKGQGAQQADKDRFECHEWARQQSGFDPSQAAPAAPTSTAAIATSAQGQGAAPAMAGMAMGAAGGAAVAELADRDAGKGAAVGVLGAGLRQRAKQQQAMSAQQQQQQAQQQQVQQQQTARAQQRGLYDRGFAACMEGRGYVVK